MELPEIYKKLADNISLAETKPETADTSLKNALITVIDCQDEVFTNTMLSDINNAYKWKLYHPLVDTYINIAVDKLNRYVISQNIDLTYFVNNTVDWDDGIPSQWVEICERCGFDTSLWSSNGNVPLTEGDFQGEGRHQTLLEGDFTTPLNI